MGRHYFTIWAWENIGPYDEPPERIYYKGDEWDDELEKEFDIRQESEIEDIDE